MKNSELQQYFERYLQAETSELEEQQLRDAALSDGSDAPEEMKLLFAFFEEEKNITTNVDIPLPQPEEEKEAKVVGMPIRQVISIAAGLLLLIGVFYGVNKQAVSTKGSAMAQSVESPDEALQVVMESLGMVSSSLNTGIQISQTAVQETEVFEIINL